MFHIGIATQHPPLPEPGQLSDLGIDFIEQCLTLEAHRRPTATELLQHPWLVNTMQQLFDHSASMQESYFSHGTQSLASTLVASEGLDSVPFAVQLAAAKEQAAVRTPDVSLSHAKKAKSVTDIM
jgi:mitogen-activated protein kinase kinase kinase